MKATRVKVYRDEAGEWRWTAYAADNEKIADSGEGYVNHGHALEMVNDQYPGIAIEEQERNIAKELWP